MQMLAPSNPIYLWLHGVGHADRSRTALAAMTHGNAESRASASAPARHIPVLLRDAIAHLAPHDGGVYIDGTFGAGGYAGAILAAADTRVIGIDRDPTAIAAAQAQVERAAGRLTLVEGEFARLDRVA